MGWDPNGHNRDRTPGLPCIPAPCSPAAAQPALCGCSLGVQGAAGPCQPRRAGCTVQGRRCLCLAGSREPLSPRGRLAPGAGTLRSRRGQWDVQPPLEVVVAMGSIVGSFPPVLYILHLAFHWVNNNANSFCSRSCLFTVFPPFATYNE